MKKKCVFCSKGINVGMEYFCKCKSVFCCKHRFPDMHNCPYDYLQESQELLAEKNPKIDHAKIIKI